MARSMVEATNKFIGSLDWLSDEDLPAVVAMENIAEAVDREGIVSGLMGQYGLAYRNLLARAPKGSAEVDPLEAALRVAAGE